jgi:hypothetical protein
MPNLLSLIKQAASDAVNEAAPCAVFFGRVQNKCPLRVKLGDRFVLDEAHLVLLEAAKDIEADDTVMLQRVQGGKKYVIVDRVFEDRADK